MARATHAALRVPQMAVSSTVKCFAVVYVAGVDAHVVGDRLFKDGVQVDEIISCSSS